jgi:hypothetical protein
MLDYVKTLPHAALIKVLGGLYNFSGTVIIPALSYGGITIEGMGAACTTIYMANGSNCDAFATSITAGSSTFITIRGLMINGNRANNPSGGRGYYDGLGTGQCADTLFQNVFFYNMNGNCAEFNSCWGTRFVDCIFEDSNAKGVYFKSGTDARITGSKFIHILGNPIHSNSPATKAINNIIFMAGISNIGINFGTGASYSFAHLNEIHHYTEITGCTGIQVASGYCSVDTNIIECNGNTLIANGIVMTSNSSHCLGGGNIIDMPGTKISNLGTSNTITANGVAY